jgi:hypothetical protein
MHKSLVPFDYLLSFFKLLIDLFFMLALQAQLCPISHQVLLIISTKSCGTDRRRPPNRTGKVTSIRVSHFLKAWHRAYLVYPSRVKILCKTVKMVDRHNKNGPRKKWTVSSAIKKERGNNCNNSGFSTMIDADQQE